MQYLQYVLWGDNYGRGFTKFILKMRGDCIAEMNKFNLSYSVIIEFDQNFD